MTREEEIEEILVDSYGPDEQAMAWETAFQDNVTTPFKAALLGVDVSVTGFRTSRSNALQCSVLNKGRDRWIGVEDLDDDTLPDDFKHMVDLYQSWGGAGEEEY